MKSEGAKVREKGQKGKGGKATKATVSEKQETKGYCYKACTCGGQLLIALMNPNHNTWLGDDNNAELLYGNERPYK